MREGELTLLCGKHPRRLNVQVQRQKIEWLL